MDFFLPLHHACMEIRVLSWRIFSAYPRLLLPSFVIAVRLLLTGSVSLLRFSSVTDLRGSGKSFLFLSLGKSLENLMNLINIISITINYSYPSLFACK